jgi:hypothetical protein
MSQVFSVKATAAGGGQDDAVASEAKPHPLDMLGGLRRSLASLRLGTSESADTLH